MTIKVIYAIITDGPGIPDSCPAQPTIALKIMAKTYPFPIWGTQGGGLVRQEGDHYVFVEAPGFDGIQVGDRMHEMWDLIPANEAAREEDAPQEPALF